VDYHCGFSNPVAAWFLWAEHKSKIPANRQLDSYSARNCGNTRRIEPPWGSVDLSHDRHWPVVRFRICG